MKFINEHVIPFQNIFEATSLLYPTIEVIRILDAKGKCPSIVEVLPNMDSEKKLVFINSVLSLVQLIDHTYHVAENAIMIIRDQLKYRDWEYRIPMLVFVALAHDLGKIPVFRSDFLSRYAIADHPLVSAKIAEQILCDFCNAYVKNSIMDAILGHHRRETKEEDLLLSVLRQADSLSREQEVRRSLECSVKKWHNWFDSAKIIEIFLPDINIVTQGNICDIFSFKSLVYANPDYIYKKIKKLMVDQSYFDPVFMGSNKTIALLKIIDSLRIEGVILDELPKHFYGMPYRINTLKFSFCLFLTPIKIEAFNIMPSLLEARKVGWVKIISAVKPSTKESKYKALAQSKYGNM